MTNLHQKVALLAALALAPSASYSEHAEDAFFYSYGNITEREWKDLPQAWFAIGSAQLGSPELEGMLKAVFPEYLHAWENEVYSGTQICVKRLGTYMTFRTADTWKQLQVSINKPIESPCADTDSVSTAWLSLGLGMTLGQSKSDVARHLGLSSIADVATINYGADINGAVLSKSIHVEFADGKLVRINLSDSRE